ncbi:MAG: hypothetical protein ACTSVI_06300 [Promethearchaeota archaeon]
MAKSNTVDKRKKLLISLLNIPIPVNMLIKQFPSHQSQTLP